MTTSSTVIDTKPVHPPQQVFGTLRRMAKETDVNLKNVARVKSWLRQHNEHIVATWLDRNEDAYLHGLDVGFESEIGVWKPELPVLSAPPTRPLIPTPSVTPTPSAPPPATPPQSASEDREDRARPALRSLPYEFLVITRLQLVPPTERIDPPELTILKTLMADNGITPPALAEALHVDLDLLNRVLRHERNLSRWAYQQIAWMMGVPVETFYVGVPSANPIWADLLRYRMVDGLTRSTDWIAEQAGVSHNMAAYASYGRDVSPLPLARMGSLIGVRVNAATGAREPGDPIPLDQLPGLQSRKSKALPAPPPAPSALTAPAPAPVSAAAPAPLPDEVLWPDADARAAAAAAPPDIAIAPAPPPPVTLPAPMPPTLVSPPDLGDADARWLRVTRWAYLVDGGLAEELTDLMMEFAPHPTLILRALLKVQRG